MMIRFPVHRTRTSQGFTLIELMIALVLGLLIIGATTTVFLSNQQTSRVKTELGNAQEAFRFASQTIMRVVQQGSALQNPGPGDDNLLRVVVPPGEGRVDCFGRVIAASVDRTINTFSINNAGELLCTVVVVVLDSNGDETSSVTPPAVLVEGLDAERSSFTFGVAEVAVGYWKNIGAWGKAEVVDDWRNVRSIRVELAKQAGGEAIGATAVFSATMRCAVLGC